MLGHPRQFAVRQPANCALLWQSICLTEGEPTMPQSIVQPLRRWDPERIGPYSIVGRLGAGAMGQVFLARSTAGRLVAVKTIRVELAEEADFRARFAREVAAASRVSGVFTAAVIEANPDADLPWVATAYVPAPSLSTLVKQAGPLPVPAVRWLAAGCAEALASIHGAGLLHRDVKPSNVLVAPDGPRVIDFGIARAAERVQLTATHGASGTPAYMAPEQARDATQASPASDVFSLGATLVYAATGHAPYEGDTVMDILVRLATEPPDLTGMPDELADLVAPCLQRVPRDRPTDATILGRLGPFASQGGPGHSYLPDAAMAVIADYQHAPLVPVAADYEEEDPGSATAGSAVAGAGEDGTSGSHTPLPGFQSINGQEPLHGQPTRRGRRRKQTPDAEPSRRPPARVLLPLWARVIAAVVLLGGGIAIGAEVHGSGAQASADTPTKAPAKAPSSGATRATGKPTGTAGTSTAGTGTTGTGTTGTGTTGTSTAASNGASNPTRGSAPGPVASPPPCAVHQEGTTPELCVSQPYGDGDTVFIIHGTGFQRFTTVTVKLVGLGVSPDRPATSPDHPVTDLQGTFNYAVDQGHQFFGKLIPPGSYEVVVTAPGEPNSTATFQVNPAASGGPPPGQPPPP
jgi:serine/threonine protein kinase